MGFRTQVEHVTFARNMENLFTVMGGGKEYGTDTGQWEEVMGVA